MKRVLIALTMALVPLWAYHVAFAAGFFKVGEPAPAFTLIVYHWRCRLA